jgi:hypothetical protein
MKSEIVLEKTPQQIEEIEKETRAFTCPNCNTQLQFRTRIQIVSIGEPLSAIEVDKRDGRPTSEKALARNKLVEANQNLLDAAEKCGVFSAFWQAVETAANHIPSHRKEYFLKWLERAGKQKTPEYGLRRHLKNYEAEVNGELELWGFQDVSAILCDKQFKLFIPTKLVKGEKIEKLKFSPKGITTNKQMDLTVWIRTKYGYIAKSKVFTDELRKHSIGAFQI